MKARILNLGAWLLLTLPLFGQPYSIDRYTMAGGGTATGRLYSVRGVIGPVEAHSQPLTGGNYSVRGGFWRVTAPQSLPGSYELKISLTATNTVVVSWPLPATGFNLQQSTDLAAADWMHTTNTVTEDGTVRFIIVDPQSGPRYYRLSKP